MVFIVRLQYIYLYDVMSFQYIHGCKSNDGSFLVTIANELLACVYGSLCLQVIANL